VSFGIGGVERDGLAEFFLRFCGEYLGEKFMATAYVKLRVSERIGLGQTLLGFCLNAKEELTEEFSS